MTFDIVSLADADNPSRTNLMSLENGFLKYDNKNKKYYEPASQPPYNFGATQIELYLERGRDYYIVPSLYKKSTISDGHFNLTVFTDSDSFELEGGSIIGTKLQEPMVVGTTEETKEVLKMTKVQFFDKQEQFRDLIIREMKRLNMTFSHILQSFSSLVESKDNKFIDKEQLSRVNFKRKLIDLGFVLTEIPEDDLIVLDIENKGTISPSFFLEFTQKGLEIEEKSSVSKAPEPPPDDIIYKAIDTSGELYVNVPLARNLRDLNSWFQVGDSKELCKKKKIFPYDPVQAAECTANVIKNRIEEVKKISLNAVHQQLLSNDETNETIQPISSPRSEFSSPVKKTAQSSNIMVTKYNEDPKKNIEIAQNNRLIGLKNLREYSQAAQNEVALPLPPTSDHSILRRKNYNKKAKKYSIDEDPYSLAWLGLKPSKSMQAHYNKITKNNEPDFWDFLIDNVISVSVSRVSAEPFKSSYSFSQFVSLKPYQIDFEKVPKSDATSGISAPVEVKSLNGVVSKVVSRASAGHTPSVQAANKSRVGTASVSLSTRSNEKQNIHLAQAKLEQIRIQNLNLYNEIFCRILPLTSIFSLERKTSTNFINDPYASISSIFLKFDKLKTGKISIPEFKLACSQFSLNLSLDDCRLFATRFPPEINSSRIYEHSNVDSIDWKSFISYISEVDIYSDSDKLNFSKSNIASLLYNLKNTLRLILASMAKNNISTFSKYLIAVKSDKFIHADTDEIPKDFVFSDSIFFNSLNYEDCTKNKSIFQSLGFNAITDFEVLQISRIFSFNINKFMAFVLEPFDFNDFNYFHLLISAQLVYRSGVTGKDLFADSPGFVDAFKSLRSKGIDRLFKYLRLRGDSASPSTDSPASDSSSVSNATSTNEDKENLNTKSSSTPRVSSIASPASLYDKDLCFDLTNCINQLLSKISLSSTIKLWGTVHKDNSDYFTFNEFTQFILKLIVDDFVANSRVHIKNNYSEDNLSDICEQLNINFEKLEFFAKFLAESVFRLKINDHFNVNRISEKLSFPGFDGFVRPLQHSIIERKFKFVNQVLKNLIQSESNYLVRLYLSNSNDKILILIADPLTSEVYSHIINEDISSWIKVDQLEKRTMDLIYSVTKKEIFDKLQLTSFKNLPYVNYIDAPYEENILVNGIKRLKILRSSRENSSIILSEDPLLISQIKQSLDNVSYHLPFFYNVDDFFLSFEVDQSQTEVNEDSNGTNQFKVLLSFRNFIFKNLRAHKSIVSFFSQIDSSLKVILCTYNSSYKEEFQWKEMLSHLTNSRNPFFTVELLPKYIKPENFLYDENINLIENTDEEEDDEQSKNVTFHTSPIDYDGSPFPRWNDLNLTFNFNPPKILSSRIVYTEIVKMKINNIEKYVIIIVRENLRKIKINEGSNNRDLNLNDNKSYTKNEKFWFLTLYDPRSSTEFQCGLINKSPLYNILYYHKLDKNVDIPLKPDQSGISLYDIKKFSVYLNQAVIDKHFIIGPAITPRLEIQLFNQKNDKLQEFIGKCQVSISSLLRGSSIREKLWANILCTINTSINKGGATELSSIETKEIDMIAGEIFVDVSFKNSLEIEKENLLKPEKASSRPASRKNSKARLLSPRIKKSPEEILLEKIKNLEGQIEKLDETLAHKDEEIIAFKSLKPNYAELKSLYDKLNKDNSELTSKIELGLKNEKKLNDEIVKLKNEIESIMSKIQTSDKAIDLLSKYRSDLEDLTSKNEELHQMIKEKDEQLEKWQQQIKLFEDQFGSAFLDKLSNNNSNSSGQTSSDLFLVPQPKSLRELLLIFLSRFTRKPVKVGTTTVIANKSLDGLQRLLNSYANPEGLITSRDFTTSLSELMIDVTIEFSNKVFLDLGYHLKGLSSSGNLNNKIQVYSLMDYLQNEMQNMIKDQKEAIKLTQELKTKVGTTDLNDFKDVELNSTLPINTKRPTSAMKSKNKAGEEGFTVKENEAPDNKNKKKTRDFDNKIDSKSDNEIIKDFSRSVADNVVKSAIKEEKKNDLKNDTKSKKNLKPSKKNEQKESESLETTQPISPTPPTDTLVLPDGWERRYHNKYKRYVYVNHMNKTTQWEPPIPLPPDSGTRSVPTSSSSKREKLNKTSEVKISKDDLNNDEDDDEIIIQKNTKKKFNSTIS